MSDTLVGAIDHVHDVWDIAQAYERERLGYLRAALDAVQSIPLLPAMYDVRLFTGDVMRINLREEVSRSLFQFKAYEIDLSRFLCTFLKPGMVAFDVGAHFGYFSILMARLVGEAGAVHAFEPTNETADLLAFNTGSFPTVNVHRVAVGDHEGAVQFNIYDEQHSAFNSLHAARTIDGALEPIGRVEVPMIRLDLFSLREGVLPDLVKIDAESSEAQVLDGMTGLADKMPALIVELGDFGHLSGTVPRSADLLRRLVAGGYALFDPGRHGLVRHAIRDEPYDYCNMVCLPAGMEPDGVIVA